MTCGIHVEAVDRVQELIKVRRQAVARTLGFTAVALSIMLMIVSWSCSSLSKGCSGQVEALIQGKSSRSMMSKAGKELAS